MRFERRAISAPVVALLAAGILFALFAVSLTMLAGIHSNREWMSRVREVQGVLSRTRAALVDAEAGQRGFLLTGKPAYLEPYKGAVVSLPIDLAEAKRLTADDPAQQQSIGELEPLVFAKLEEFHKSVDLYQRGQRDAALSIVKLDDGKSIMDNARRVIARMRARADDLVSERTAKSRRTFDRAMWIAGGAALGLLVLGMILFRINRDIARRKTLESALREAAAFQEQLVGIVGHDLRSPLMAILMTVKKLLRSGELPERQAAGVERVAASAARMSRLVEQLLDLTRTRLVGGIPVEPKDETNLSDLVSGVVDELRTAHGAAEIKMTIDREVRGSWDPDRIAQVVSNLVANAIAHGDGPVDVRVRNGSTSAILEVHNGGPPISPDRLPRIFEAFLRAPGDRTTPAKGLGLGLFIAERIVTAHGGRIAVHSLKEGGTTFTVNLPTASS